MIMSYISNLYLSLHLSNQKTVDRNLLIPSAEFDNLLYSNFHFSNFKYESNWSRKKGFLYHLELKWTGYLMLPIFACVLNLVRTWIFQVSGLITWKFRQFSFKKIIKKIVCILQAKVILTSLREHSCNKNI